MYRIKSYHNHLSTKFFNWKIPKTLYMKIWCRLVNVRIFALLQWYKDQRLLFHVTTQDELQCLNNKGNNLKQFCFIFTQNQDAKQLSFCIGQRISFFPYLFCCTILWFVFSLSKWRQNDKGYIIFEVKRNGTNNVFLDNLNAFVKDVYTVVSIHSSECNIH
jgi:hypothetical protein